MGCDKPLTVAGRRLLEASDGADAGLASRAPPGPLRRPPRGQVDHSPIRFFMRRVDGVEAGFKIRGHHLIHQLGQAKAADPGYKMQGVVRRCWQR